MSVTDPPTYSGSMLPGAMGTRPVVSGGIVGASPALTTCTKVGAFDTRTGRVTSWAGGVDGWNEGISNGTNSEPFALTVGVNISLMTSGAADWMRVGGICEGVALGTLTSAANAGAKDGINAAIVGMDAFGICSWMMVVTAEGMDTSIGMMAPGRDG